MCAAGDVRIDNVPDATIAQPTDAIIRVTWACICGSDRWPYGSMHRSDQGQRMGHEAIGVVEEIGAEVRTLKRGDVVVMPFAISDGTCVFCHEGLPIVCVHVGFFGNNGNEGAQAEAICIPYADGTLFALAVGADDALMPSLPTLADVMGTGHHAAVIVKGTPGHRTSITEKSVGVQHNLRDQPDDLLRRYARRLASRPPSAGRLIVEPGRTIEVACFMRFSLLTNTDRLLLMVRRRVADLWRRASKDANSWLWGDLTPEEFLLVVSDLTTWSLMHFECVSAWSAAEDFSPTEEQEGYGIIGRGRRMLPSDYADPHSTRTLQDVTNPKIRVAALWFAHSLMARRHEDAPDRTTGPAPQDRQAARIWRSPAAAREWLADRQRYWPPAYLEEFWIDPCSRMSLPGTGPDVTSIVGIEDRDY